MSTYRTVRKIDGIDYITVQEHEEILSIFTDLTKAVDELRNTVGTLGDPVRNLATTLKKVQKS